MQPRPLLGLLLRQSHSSPLWPFREAETPWGPLPVHRGAGLGLRSRLQGLLAPLLSAVVLRPPPRDSSAPRPEPAKPVRVSAHLKTIVRLVFRTAPFVPH